MNPIRLFDATLYVVVFTILGAHAGVIVNTTITQVTDPTTANHNTSTLKDLLDIKCMLNAAITMVALVVMYFFCLVLRGIIASLPPSVSTLIPGQTDHDIRPEAAVESTTTHEVAIASGGPRVITAEEVEQETFREAINDLPISHITEIISTQV